MGVSSRAEAAGDIFQPPRTSTRFQEQDDADHRADRRVTLHAGAQFAEVDVEHHDDEQEQDRDGADIDDEQDEGEELGSRDEEQPRRVEEAENEEQHGVDRVAGRDDHDRGRHQDRREDVEEDVCEDHGAALSIRGV